MNYCFKNTLRVLGIKIATSFISICMMIAFTWLFNMKYGFLVYSTFTAVIISGWLFSEGNNAGRKFQVKEKGQYFGFVCGAIPEIISVLLLLCILIFKDLFMGLNIAYWAYNAPFMGFFNYTGKVMLMTEINIFYLIPVLCVPVIYEAGYYRGYNRIESKVGLLERLVYKKSE